MRTLTRIANSLMWVVLGLFLLTTPIVTYIDRQLTNWVVFNAPDNVDNGVVYWEEALEGANYHEWYTVSTLAPIVGVVLIIGGLLQLGVVIYEKYRKDSV